MLQRSYRDHATTGSIINSLLSTTTHHESNFYSSCTQQQVSDLRREEMEAGLETTERSGTSIRMK